MGFWLTVFVLLFIYLVIILFIKVLEERRMRKNLKEISGKV